MAALAVHKDAIIIIYRKRYNSGLGNLPQRRYCRYLL